MNDDFVPLDLMADSCLSGATSVESYLAFLTGCGLTAEDAIKRIIRAADLRVAGKDPYSEIVGNFRFSARISKVCLAAEFARPTTLSPEIQYAFKIRIAPDCPSGAMIGKQKCDRWELAIDNPSQAIFAKLHNTLVHYDLLRDECGIKSPEILSLTMTVVAWPVGIERYQNSPDILAKLTSPDARAPILNLMRDSLLPPAHVSDQARAWSYIGSGPFPSQAVARIGDDDRGDLYWKLYDQTRSPDGTDLSPSQHRARLDVHLSRNALLASGIKSLMTMEDISSYRFRDLVRHDTNCFFDFRKGPNAQSIVAHILWSEGNKLPQLVELNRKIEEAFFHLEKSWQKESS